MVYNDSYYSSAAPGILVSGFQIFCCMGGSAPQGNLKSKWWSYVKFEGHECSSGSMPQEKF